MPYSSRSLYVLGESTRRELENALDLAESGSWRRSGTPRWFVIMGLIGLTAYAIFLGRHTTVIAGGSDS